MADKYDRLLSDYYTGLLNKKLQMFEELEISQILRLSRPDEYRDLKRTIDLLDNVIAALRPIHKDILRARYGTNYLMRRFRYASISLRRLCTTGKTRQNSGCEKRGCNG